ncbi:unnamed protein product [Chrysoparadoxa australica]
MRCLSMLYMTACVSAFSSSFMPGPPQKFLQYVKDASLRKIWPAIKAHGACRGGCTMRFVAMNRFKVKLGFEEEFEKVWRERESKLANFSGFVRFRMLRADDGEPDDEGLGASATAGYAEFISETSWMHRMDFDEWRQSQAFKGSHGKSEGGGGGMSKMGKMLLEPPQPTLYDVVLEEPQPPEETGELWDFEVLHASKVALASSSQPQL